MNVGPRCSSCKRRRARPGQRTCRLCHAVAQRAYRQRVRQQLAALRRRVRELEAEP